MKWAALSCIPLFVGLSIPPTQEQEVYTFKVQVRNVYVDVFVNRNDKPVADLERDNFVVLDNGTPQEFQLIDVKSLPLSAILALDVSGSVRGKKLEHLRAAAHAFVDGLGAEDEAGLLTFTNKMRLRKGLDGNFDELHRALDRTRGGGSTAFYDSLFVALKLLEGARGRPLLILFTDGLDNSSWLIDSDLHEIAGASDAVIYSVGVRTGGGVTIDNRQMEGPPTIGGRLLKRITESTGGQVWYAENTSNLKDLYLRILAEMETRYLLVYQPEGTLEEGWHKIEVNLKGTKSGDVRARSGYFVSSTEN